MGWCEGGGGLRVLVWLLAVVELLRALAQVLPQALLLALRLSVLVLLEVSMLHTQLLLPPPMRSLLVLGSTLAATRTPSPNGTLPPQFWGGGGAACQALTPAQSS